MPLVNEIQKALKRYFETVGGGYVFHWPNQRYGEENTFIDCDVIFTAGSSDDLGGEDFHHTGFVAFVAVIPNGVSTELAFQMFDAVAQKAQKGVRIPLVDGHVLFTEHAQILSAGFQSDSDWRLPFQVTFQTS